MAYYLFATLYVLSCLLLLLVVLLQQGKGGDMASAFGGGSSQTAFGARAGATVLTKATAILGALFMVGAIALGIIGKRGESSLLGGYRAPVSAPAPKPTPAPQQQSPAPTQTPEKAPAPAPEKK
jgi:preprotein translocase subunit SecG